MMQNQNGWLGLARRGLDTPQPIWEIADPGQPLEGLRRINPVQAQFLVAEPVLPHATITNRNTIVVAALTSCSDLPATLRRLNVLREVHRCPPLFPQQTSPG